MAYNKEAYKPPWEYGWWSIIRAVRSWKNADAARQGAEQMTAEGITTRLPTRMIAGKQMVSLRAIAEARGMQVEWDPQTSKARIIDK